MSKQSLKPGWKIVKFGDVVKNANLVERDFNKAGIERIVGLDHIDPENLHIRRWNTPENGTSFSRRFVPGQTLFGKRRAYQRKVAYAEFEGVCSGDILTFESKDPKVLLPELLPFICQSDPFFNHALGTSAGSLSPRTSWNALKYFEFPLPHIEKQKPIAEILWAADEVVEKVKKFFKDLVFVEKRILIHMFKKISEWPSYKISSLGDVQLGRQRAPKYTTGRDTKSYLRVINVLDGSLDLSDVEQMDFNTKDFERYHLVDGDILITEGDITSPYNVGRSAIYRGEIDGCCFQNTLIRLRCGENLTPEYASLCLRYMLHKGVFAGVANTTTVTHLGGTRFGAMKMSVPSLKKQHMIVNTMNHIYEQVAAAEQHDARAVAVAKSLKEDLLKQRCVT